MNDLANILLVDLLQLIAREQADGLLDWSNEDCLTRLSTQLMNGYSIVMASYSGEALEKCSHFALHCGINWRRMALQAAFWCDNSSHGYPSWVAQRKLPENLYEKEARINIDAASAANFDPIKGFQTDGEQDIGPYNGPLCLVEMERAFYTLFMAVILPEPLVKEEKKTQHNNSLNDFFYF
jgi:hypothetical protein